MLDLSHIPNSQQDIQIFNANGSAWQTWRKPKKCNYVYIMCIGGGSGGCGGLTAGAGSFGSVAGASGAISRSLYNSQHISDILYIQVGLGGLGGVANTSGNNATRTFVSLQPSLIAQNTIQCSGNAAAIGGNTAATISSGETVVAQTSATFLTLSNFIGIAGVNSLAASFTPTNVTPFSSQLLTCGAQGGFYSGSTTSDGGSINSSSLSPLIKGGLSSITTNGQSGGNGITSYKPFYSLGGAGGGSSSVGFGGNGGNGGIGSGGGGGGNGLLGGGTGGKGGDGLVIIISF